MGLTCLWMVLCERVIVDRDRGTLTLVGCTDQILSPLFPSYFPGFAFAAVFSGAEPASLEGARVELRFVRYSDRDAEEELLTFSVPWSPGGRRLRVYQNFTALRLHRSETIWFRLDHRVQDGAWVLGMPAPVEVSLAQSSEEPAPARLPGEDERDASATAPPPLPAPRRRRRPS